MNEVKRVRIIKAKSVDMWYGIGKQYDVCGEIGSCYISNTKDGLKAIWKSDCEVVSEEFTKKPHIWAEMDNGDLYSFDWQMPKNPKAVYIRREHSDECIWQRKSEQKYWVSDESKYKLQSVACRIGASSMSFDAETTDLIYEVLDEIHPIEEK